MKKTLVVMVALFTALFMSGCDVRISAVNDSVINDAKQNITYFKDDHGICYAMVQSGKIAGSNSGIGLTDVPCEKVGLAD